MSSEQNILELFFQHHLWSNLHLFDACLTLDNAQLRYTAPGTYGSIGATLTHLVHAEERYLAYLTGQEAIYAPHSDGETAVSELKARIQKCGEQFLKMLPTVQPNRGVEVEDEGQIKLIPAKIFILQAIHHAHEHRTQVATMLGQQGIKPPHISGWSYHDDHQ